MEKLHFRPYIPTQMVLFSQRIDENIAENVPVRIVNAVVWKIQRVFLPYAKTKLTPWNYFNIAPLSFQADGVIFILVYLFFPTFILRTLSPESSI